MDAKNGSESEQTSVVKLSSEQAEILLKADLRNLARKVQTGKTLSVAERNLLQSALAGENLSSVEFAKNAVELASILDVDRKTIQRWRKVESNPGVRPDGRYHVPSWRAFKLARQGMDSSDDGFSQPKLRARQIFLQNQWLEFQLALLLLRRVFGRSILEMNSIKAVRWCRVKRIHRINIGLCSRHTYRRIGFKNGVNVLPIICQPQCVCGIDAVAFAANGGPGQLRAASV